jgi:transposase-like protein
MNASMLTDPDIRHRFPTKIVTNGAWLYYRLCLSYRNVEDLLFARLVIVTYEAIREWRCKFGQLMPISSGSGVLDLGIHVLWMRCF